MSDEAPPWSEEALAFLALADVALDAALAKHGLRPADGLLNERPTQWMKSVAGRVGPHWMVVRAWSTPSLAGNEQVNLWFYAFRAEPDSYDLDRDRVYSTSECGADALRVLLDRLLDRASRAALATMRTAFREAQMGYNRETAPDFDPDGRKNTAN